MDLSNPYFQTVSNGMLDRSNELGISLTIADAESSSEKQITDMYNALDDGFDILICSPLQPESCIPVVQKAKEMGIPFINPNQTIIGSDAHINLDDFTFGKLGGEIAGTWINEKLPEDCQVLIIGYTQMKALQERSKGIRAGILEKAPKAQIIAEVSALTPEVGMLESEKILKRYPNIKVIAAVNDAAALGAMTAVNALSNIDKDFCIVGLDATSESLNRMESESSLFRGTVDINPYGMGRMVIDTAIQVYEEGPIKEIIPIKMNPIYWDGR